MSAPRLVSAILCAAVLSGCSAGSGGSGGGGLRRSLGLEAPPPDATLVVSRAPIAVPSDLTTLPPPQPGAPSRVERNPQAEAQAALLGGAVTPPAAAPTRGEQALLAATGATEADPAIRQTVIAETPEPERRFGLTSLFGRPIPNRALEAERLSPVEEAEALRRQGLPAPTPDPRP